MSKYKWGKKSKRVLSDANIYLYAVLNHALSMGIMDMAVIESIRGKAEQNQYFKLGKSKVQWPNGKHNILKEGDKSDAIDVTPVVNGKISWKKEHCLVLAGIILASAKIIGIEIRWGGNWDMDGEPITDQNFQDLVHYEIMS
jgi:peptidoglycan L-alanyl-D-glutamate endopeptidase CwlK